jgi:hypothetical protein
MNLISEQAFAEKMVAKYRELLLNSAGMKSVTIDGQSVSYADLEAAYDHWSQKLVSRPLVATINLGNT